jgi:hypothetical protein
MAQGNGKSNLELQVSEIIFFPAPAAYESSIAKIKFRVTNRGKTDSGPFVVEVSSEHQVAVGVVSVDNVPAGKRYDFTFYARVPFKAQPRDIGLRISSSFPLGAQGIDFFRDISSQNILFEPPGPAAEGTSVRFCILLRNEGKCAARYLTWRMMDGDKRIVGDILIPLLLAGETHRSQFYLWRPTEPGVHRLSLIINPDPRDPHSTRGQLLKVIEYEVLPKAK